VPGRLLKNEFHKALSHNNLPQASGNYLLLWQVFTSLPATEVHKFFMGRSPFQELRASRSQLLASETLSALFQVLAGDVCLAV